MAVETIVKCRESASKDQNVDSRVVESCEEHIVIPRHRVEQMEYRAAQQAYYA